LPKGVDGADPDVQKRQCEHCGKLLSSYISMRRHVRNSCARARAARGLTKAEALEQGEATARAKAALEARVEALEAELVAAKAAAAEVGGGGGKAPKPPAVINNIGTQNNNGPVTAHGNIVDQRDQHVEVHNHNHVVENHYHEAPRVFGDEDVERISRGVVAEFMDRAQEAGGGDALSQASTLIAILIREVYSGSSAFLKNVREKKVLTLLPNKGWQAQDLGAVARKMGATAVNLAFDKQPHEDAARYDSLLKAMGANETDLVTSSRGVSCEVLANNKRAVMERLGRQPRIGEEAGLMAIADAKGKGRLSVAAAAAEAAAKARSRPSEAEAEAVARYVAQREEEERRKEAALAEIEALRQRRAGHW
jgi:hypothetical protein